MHVYKRYTWTVLGEQLYICTVLINVCVLNIVRMYWRWISYKSTQIDRLSLAFTVRSCEIYCEHINEIDINVNGREGKIGISMTMQPFYYLSPGSGWFVDFIAKATIGCFIWPYNLIVQYARYRFNIGYLYNLSTFRKLCVCALDERKTFKMIFFSLPDRCDAVKSHRSVLDNDW